MGLKVTVQPVAEPLSLDETKLHLRVDHDFEDTLIESMIQAAREYCEQFARRSFITQTIVQTFDNFPIDSHHAIREWDGCSGRRRRAQSQAIELEQGPVQEVVSIEYFDEATSAYITLATDKYQVSLNSEVKDRITPAPGVSWPSTHPDRLDAVRITYKAGFSDSPYKVPKSARNAMLLLIGGWYANREAFLLSQGSDMPVGGVDALLWTIRSF